MPKIKVTLLESTNKIKKEAKLIKPPTYKDLIQILSQKLKNIEDNYELFILDKNNEEIKIDNEEKYKEIIDILFIRKIDNDLLEKSMYEVNYDLLSEASQEILDEKYNCKICSDLIENENPYLCYKCQKIFHEKCLKDWDKRCRLQNRILSCPNCRNQLSLKKWNKKVDYEDSKNNDANLMNKINKYKKNTNMNNYINLIKERKINKLKENENKQNELIKKYENYIHKSIELFKSILNKLNSIHSLLKLKENNKLNDILNNYSLKIYHLEIDEISNILEEELDLFKNTIINKNKKEENEKNNANNDIEIVLKLKDLNNLKQLNLNNIKFVGNLNTLDNIKNSVNKLQGKYNNNQKEEHPVKNKINKINLIYNAECRDYYYIFGQDFVKNNKNNIQLIINGINTELYSRVLLKEGINTVTMIINKNLTNLNHMFFDCGTLKGIDDLQYLDISKVKDCSYMFYGCSLLSNINSLKNFDISNCTNFSGMFSGCRLLSDIKSLSNWNVSNCKDFSGMFDKCTYLSDIKPLENWNVSNCEDFSCMFRECISLKDIKPLEKWNVSNCNDFSFMFYGCNKLSDIKPIRNWKFLDDYNAKNMFAKCPLLPDSKCLQIGIDDIKNYFFKPL